jgi:uncharacterized repeat protein (TIGR01451 family)
MMKKNATLNPDMANAFPHNGTYPNPVSVLYNENIEYRITAVNANLKADSVFITDTLPPYLRYVDGSATGSVIRDSDIYVTPKIYTFNWKIPAVSSLADTTVSFQATPEGGVSASQPFYINNAWVRVSDTLRVMTNKTYHQGAGVSVVTFSASLGGSIFHAGEQALDYRTSPRSGILVAPDEGYRFAGWRHDEYVSLKGEVIKADSGIMFYDALTIYGSVELRAVFELDDSGDDNGRINRKIEEITKPQQTGDRIWASESTLYVRTNKPGSIVRIYSPDGVLYEQHTIITEGTTEIQLEQGIYVVTLNNGIGQKVVVR